VHAESTLRGQVDREIAHRAFEKHALMVAHAKGCAGMTPRDRVAQLVV
jgi:hypothetical protein